MNVAAIMPLFQKTDAAYNRKIMSGEWLKFAVRLHDDQDEVYATAYYNIGDHAGQLLPPMYFGILYEVGREAYGEQMTDVAPAQAYVRQTLSRTLPKMDRSLFDGAILAGCGASPENVQFTGMYSATDAQGNTFIVFGVTASGEDAACIADEAYVLMMVNLRHGNAKYHSCYLFVDQADVAAFVKALDVPEESPAAAWLAGHEGK